MYRVRLLFTDGGRVGDISIGNKRRNPAPTVFTLFAFRRVYCLNYVFVDVLTFPAKNRSNNKRREVLFWLLFVKHKNRIYVTLLPIIGPYTGAEKIDFRQIRIFNASSSHLSTRVERVGASAVVPRSTTSEYRSFVAGK